MGRISLNSCKNSDIYFSHWPKAKLYLFLPDSSYIKRTNYSMLYTYSSVLYLFFDILAYVLRNKCILLEIYFLIVMLSSKNNFFLPLLTADLITYKLFSFILFQNGSFQVFLFSSYKLRKCLICSQDWKCYITRNIFILMVSNGNLIRSKTIIKLFWV